MFSQQGIFPSKLFTRHHRELCYDDIKSMIEGHFNYLMQHKIYLAKIDKGLISEADIESYMEDVIGIPYTKTVYTRLETLKIIKTKLEGVLELFAQLSILNKTEDRDHAMILQYFLLELGLENSHFSVKMKNYKFRSNETEISRTFNEYSQIRALLKSLKPLLPDIYTHLSKGIKIGTKTFDGPIDYSRNLSETGQKTQILGDWKNFVENYKVALDSLDCLKYFSQERSVNRTLNELKYVVMNSPENAFIIRLYNIAIDFSQGSKAYHELPDPTNNVIATKNAVFEFNEKIVLLIEAKKILDEVKNKFDNQNRASVLHELLWPKLKNKIQALEFKFQLIDNEFNRINSNKKLSLFKDRISIVKNNVIDVDNQIKLLKNVWQANQTTQFSSENDLNLIADELTKIQKELTQKMTLALDELRSFTTRQKSSSDKSNENETVQESSNANYNERRIYLEQQLEKTKQYKEKIAKQREEKILTLKTESHTPSVAVPESSPVLEKNEEMEELLENLNTHHLELLEMIFNYDKDIKYTDVYNLITNHLGGEILEIGNGSSHKRIHLGKYYSEINSHDQVSGGLYKPHGRQHNSGGMSRFNLELVVKTLNKAGITLEVVKELQGKLAMKNR